MATKRTYIDPISGSVVHFNENRTYMSPFGNVVSEQLLVAAEVTHDNTAQLAGTGATATQSTTLVSGDTLVVKIATKGSGITVSGVAFDPTGDNDALTLVGTDINGDARSTMFVLASDDVTTFQTADVVVTYSGSNRNVIGVSVYKTADPTTPVKPSSAATANGTDASPTVNVTGSTDGLIVDSLAQVSAGPDTAAPAGSGIERHDLDSSGGGTDTRGASQDLTATGGSDTMAWTMGGSDNWATVAMALQITQPAAAGNPWNHYAQQ